MVLMGSTPPREREVPINIEYSPLNDHDLFAIAGLLLGGEPAWTPATRAPASSPRSARTVLGTRRPAGSAPQQHVHDAHDVHDATWQPASSVGHPAALSAPSLVREGPAPTHDKEQTLNVYYHH